MLRKAILTLTVILIAIGSIYSISGFQNAQNKGKNAGQAKPNQTSFGQTNIRRIKTQKPKRVRLLKERKRKISVAVKQREKEIE